MGNEHSGSDRAVNISKQSTRWFRSTEGRGVIWLPVEVKISTTFHQDRRPCLLCLTWRKKGCESSPHLTPVIQMCRVWEWCDDIMSLHQQPLFKSQVDRPEVTAHQHFLLGHRSLHHHLTAILRASWILKKDYFLRLKGSGQPPFLTNSRNMNIERNVTRCSPNCEICI